jgi:hypothetical protein
MIHVRFFFNMLMLLEKSQMSCPNVFIGHPDSPLAGRLDSRHALSALCVGAR